MMDKSIRKTGGQVDDLVLALIDTAYDKKIEVRNDIARALHQLGKNQPELVLSTCSLYLSKHQKLASGHRVVLFEIMKNIIKDAGESVPIDLAKELIHLASTELTKSKDVEPEWQMAPSSLLVALGARFSDDVMSELLGKLEPGTLPHYFTVLTLANLATENVFGVVPFMKDIFSRMMLMVGMAKADNMRWVFAHCIGCFSEAILDYCANIDTAPYPDISKDRFYGEIFSAYEIMFNVWIQSREAKLRLAIVKALGPMANLMAKDKLEEQLQKLLHGVTSLYRKHSEHYIITQGLCMILDAATSDSSQMLLPLIDQLLNGLHNQACVEPDYTNIHTVKNHNEILRCFQVLNKAFSDRVVTFLQLKLEAGNEKSKVATLTIIKHLINSSGSSLDNKKEVILAGLTVPLQESSLKIRKTLAQVVIAMAHHGYLDLEGGEKMVEFVVRQCAIGENEKVVKRANEDDYVSPATVKAMCENILHLMTTTVEIVEDVLWPFLMECLIPVHYTEAMMAVCKSLAYLASKKREGEAEDYQINYVQQVNIPKPQALISRLLVMAGHPLRGGGRGIHALKFLRSMSPNLHAELVELWDTVIPRLIQYLEDHTSDPDEWNQKSWEDLILKLLAKTLGQIKSEEWYLALGREMGQQISLYNNLPEEKNFLFKCLGVVLRRIGTTDFIREHLNLIFSTVDHSNQVEREGCAVGVGFCAASHLDQCLVKLEEITKTQMVRKSAGFMGLLKDKSEVDVERIKSTIMLCYGYVVFYGPPGLIVSRLETNVLRVISPHLSSSRDIQVKLNLTRAVDLIGKAVQPSHLLRNDFIFTRRGDLLKHMQAFLMSESKTPNNETKSLAIDATTNLVKLEPKLAETELQDVLKVCTESVYPITLAKGADTRENEAAEKGMKQALESLNNLLKEISSKDSTPTGLLSIWKLLEPYIVSPADQERERGIQSVKVVFQHYLQSNTTFTESHFSTLGNLIGRALPRCTDPVMSVRQHAIECVQILLTVNDRYEGVPSNVTDERIEALGKLKDVLTTEDPSVLFNIVNELSVVINKKTPDEQLKNLVYSLIDGLKDQHSQSSSGACVMLNCIMKCRGAELGGEINNIVVDIHNELIGVTFQPTITGSIVALRTLASHHLIPVLTAFLNFPVPFSPIVKDFWQTLAKDKDLTQDTFDHLLDLLLRSAPFSEKEDPRDKKATVRIATNLPITVSCALTEMCRVPESETLVISHFAKLFSAVLLRMGSCLGVKPPQISPDQKGKKKDSIVPMSLALDCFKEVMKRSNCQNFKPYIEEKDGWTLLEDEKTFTDGLEVVAVGLCQCVPKYINDVVSCLVPALTSTYDNQRVVPTAIFAELINQRCRGDMQLVEILMNSLLSKLVDPSHTVRRLCIRGLGNVANVGGPKLQTYSTTILSAMMAGMDDKEDPENSITLEAMSGLSRILNKLDESSIRQILINICLRIRPCFEKDHDDVRAAAISLFGNLARFGTGPSESAFIEQVHTNFVSILLHLNEEPSVTKSCKVALRQLGPRLQSAAINDMFQKHLIEGGQLHYGEFMNDLSRLIIADYPSKVNFYVMSCVGFFKSSWSDIRANAALFVGFLLGNLKPEQRDELSTEHVCGALIMLLKDISAKVRSSAAEAISLLHDY